MTEGSAHFNGYADGWNDAIEGGVPLTDVQLTYHGEEYAEAYRAGFADAERGS